MWFVTTSIISSDDDSIIVIHDIKNENKKEFCAFQNIAHK